MGLFGGLKHEHKIYDKDFKSNEIFEYEINNMIERLNEKKDKVQKLITKDYHGWENNQVKEGYEELLEETINELKKSIDDLKELKGDLK